MSSGPNATEVEPLPGIHHSSADLDGGVEPFNFGDEAGAFNSQLDHAEREAKHIIAMCRARRQQIRDEHGQKNASKDTGEEEERKRQLAALVGDDDKNRHANAAAVNALDSALPLAGAASSLSTLTLSQKRLIVKFLEHTNILIDGTLKDIKSVQSEVAAFKTYMDNDMDNLLRQLFSDDAANAEPNIKKIDNYFKNRCQREQKSVLILISDLQQADSDFFESIPNFEKRYDKIFSLQKRFYQAMSVFFNTHYERQFVETRAIILHYYDFFLKDIAKLDPSGKDFKNLRNRLINKYLGYCRIGRNGSVVKVLQSVSQDILKKTSVYVHQLDRFKAINFEEIKKLTASMLIVSPSSVLRN